MGRGEAFTTAAALRAMRREARGMGLSQSEVERRAGLAKGTISRWGDGAEPRVGNLLAALGVVGVSVSME